MHLPSKLEKFSVDSPKSISRLPWLLVVLRRSIIGSKNSCNEKNALFFNQSQNNGSHAGIYPARYIFSCFFSRAWLQLLVFALNSDWFTALSSVCCHLPYMWFLWLWFSTWQNWIRKFKFSKQSPGLLYHCFLFHFFRQTNVSVFLLTGYGIWCRLRQLSNVCQLHSSFALEPTGMTQNSPK